MANINGTNVASKIVPFTTDDTYATHDETYGVGGYRTVASVTEMNNIPSARRKEGMLVNVTGDKIYKLVNGSFVDAGLGGGEEQELAILKLPSAVATLTSSSTVEQVKNAFGGDSGITLILNSITSGKKYVAGVSNTVVDGITANAVLPVIATGIQGSNRNLVLSHPMNYYTINLALANGVVSIYVNPTYNASMSDDPLNAVQCGVVKQYIDSMSGGGTGGSEVYYVDVSKLDFTQVADGVSASQDQIDEVTNCITYWAQGKPVIYNNPNAILSIGDYVGTLNIGFNPSTMVASFIMPFSQDGGDGAFLYMLDTQAASWTVQMLDGGGGGSSNAKYLTTSNLFTLDRGEHIRFNAADTAILKSLFSNGYRKSQLYYVGAPTGDWGVYPVSIECGAFPGALSDSDSLWMSITLGNGLPIYESLYYYEDGDYFETANATAFINSQMTFHTQSTGTNGYLKFHNGTMIQWGYIGGSSTTMYNVTMPSSFYNTTYIVFATVNKPRSDSSLYSASPIDTSKTVSSFYINRNYASGGSTGLSQESWQWFAIGRWK